MRFASIIVSLAIAPWLIAASAPLRLKPSSPWDVDYGENSCRLMRIFGEGPNKTSLLIESAAPGSMTMLLVGQPLKTGQREVPAKLRPEAGEPMKGRLAESTEDHAPAVLWSGLELEPEAVVKRRKKEAEEERKHSKVRPAAFDLAQRAMDESARHDFESRITAIEIDVRSDRSVILETGPLQKPMKIFDLCMHDALKEWGVNPDIEDKIVRPAWTPEPPPMVRRGRLSARHDHPQQGGRSFGAPSVERFRSADELHQPELFQGAGVQQSGLREPHETSIL